MKTRLDPYIAFKDNAREAIEFYKSIFGGNVDIMTFADAAGNMKFDEGEENKIMHAMLEADNGVSFMLCDTPNSADYEEGGNVSLTLSGDDDDLLVGYFNKLAEGGVIAMPMQMTFWGDKFGMCTDKFGVKWMVDIGIEKDDEDDE